MGQAVSVRVEDQGLGIPRNTPSGYLNRSSASRRARTRRSQALAWDWRFVAGSFVRTGGVSGSSNDPEVERLSYSRCLQPGAERGNSKMRTTILVADDEAPMRKYISTNLKVRGYDVIEAADGGEALKLVEEHVLDLVLLDMGMPGRVDPGAVRPAT